MEKEIKVVPYRVEYVCDKCGEGEMCPNGIMKLTSPPKWEHQCTNIVCNNRENFFEEYPYIRYREEVK